MANQKSLYVYALNYFAVIEKDFIILPIRVLLSENKTHDLELLVLPTATNVLYFLEHNKRKISQNHDQVRLSTANQDGNRKNKTRKTRLYILSSIELNPMLLSQVLLRVRNSSPTLRDNGAIGDVYEELYEQRFSQIDRQTSRCQLMSMFGNFYEYQSHFSVQLLRHQAGCELDDCLNEKRQPPLMVYVINVSSYDLLRAREVAEAKAVAEENQQAKQQQQRRRPTKNGDTSKQEVKLVDYQLQNTINNLERIVWHSFFEKRFVYSNVYVKLDERRDQSGAGGPQYSRFEYFPVDTSDLLSSVLKNNLGYKNEIVYYLDGKNWSFVEDLSRNVVTTSVYNVQTGNRFFVWLMTPHRFELIPYAVSPLLSPVEMAANDRLIESVNTKTLWPSTSKNWSGVKPQFTELNTNTISGDAIFIDEFFVANKFTDIQWNESNIMATDKHNNCMFIGMIDEVALNRYLPLKVLLVTIP